MFTSRYRYRPKQRPITSTKAVKARAVTRAINREAKKKLADKRCKNSFNFERDEITDEVVHLTDEQLDNHRGDLLFTLNFSEDHWEV